MKLTSVNCNLRDCIFFQEDPSKPYIIYCKYPDIMLYKNHKRCPVYRMDWEKKMKNIQTLKKTPSQS